MTDTRKQSVTSYYDSVARDYDDAFYRRPDPYPPLQYRHRHILNLLEEELPATGAVVLDIGCGPGEMAADLAKRGWRVHGIDISSSMIDIARKNVRSALGDYSDVTLGVGDIENLPFPDAFFDAVVCAGVIEYLDGDEAWARELRRVLKPGGILVINVTNRWAVRRWSLPVMERFKSLPIIASAADFIKRRMLGRGEVNRFPFRPRTHDPRAFDRFLGAHGFEKIGHRYFAFSLMPYPLDTLLSGITVPIRRRLERHAEGRLGFWGTGYIVKVRRV